MVQQTAAHVSPTENGGAFGCLAARMRSGQVRAGNLRRTWLYLLLAPLLVTLAGGQSQAGPAGPLPSDAPEASAAVFLNNNSDWVSSPVPSPDGSQIAYLKATSGAVMMPYAASVAFELWVSDVEGSNARLLTRSPLLNPTLGPGGEAGLSWSASGEIEFEDQAALPLTRYAVNILDGSIRAAGQRVADSHLGRPAADVPYFGQCDARWGSNQLGTCSYTICSSGCAMSSVAMILAYYGADIDPGRFNTWLTQNGGYLNGCLLYWHKAVDYDPSLGVTYLADIRSTDWERLNLELDAGYPVVLGVSNNSHYVVATHRSGSTYYINDPYYPARTTLNAYGGTFSRLIVYHGPLPPSCAAPILDFPGDNSVSSVRQLAFTWRPDGCDPEGYQFRVQTTPDMESGGVILFDTSYGQAGTGTAIDFAPTWDQTDLYWSVRACQPCDDPSGFGEWATARHLRVEPAGSNSGFSLLKQPSRTILQLDQPVTYTVSVYAREICTAPLQLTDTLPLAMYLATPTLTTTHGSAWFDRHTILSGTLPVSLTQVHWSGTLSDTPVVTLSYAVTIAQDASGRLVNVAQFSGPFTPSLSISTTFLVEPLQTFLPLTLRSWVAAPPPAPSLANPDFEAGVSADYQGNVYIHVPEGWTPFWREGGGPLPHDPSNSYGYHWPYMNSTNAADPPRFQSGTQGLEYFNTWDVHDAGLYQQVANTAPGWPLEFGGWAHAWSTDGCPVPECQGEYGWREVYWSDGSHVGFNPFYALEGTGGLDTDEQNFVFRVGIDPTGGTDPWASTVVWGSGAHIYNQFYPVPPVVATSGSPTMTVFLRSTVLWRLRHNHAYWDHLYLQISSSAP